MKVVWPDWPQILKKIPKKRRANSQLKSKKNFKNADSKKQTPKADLIDRLQNTDFKKSPSENTSGGPR
jgi:phage antirepressor YoqD-like protein